MVRERPQLQKEEDIIVKERVCGRWRFGGREERGRGVKDGEF